MRWAFMPLINMWQSDKKFNCLLQNAGKPCNMKLQLRDWRKNWILFENYVGVPIGSVTEIQMPTAWAHTFLFVLLRWFFVTIQS